MTLLTHSWSWALLEKLPILQLLKNFPAFYGTWWFIAVFTRALHWSLSLARLIQFIPSHPIQDPFSFVGRLSKESVQVRGFLWSFVTSLFLWWGVVSTTSNPPSWRTTPCRLSTTAYSVHSQLPSKTDGGLLHPQTEDAPCRGDKGPT
jgi:hypothetical protein